MKWDSIEEMTFKDRVDWVMQMAFEGLINGGTKEMRAQIWAALNTLALVDANAGSKWALKETK